MCCLRPPSQARHSRTSAHAKPQKNNECARFLQKNLMDWKETVINTLPTIADLAIHLFCGSCHFPDCHHSVEDEEDACDQLTFQFQVCHSTSDRNCSWDGRCRSRNRFGILRFARPCSRWRAASFRAACGKIIPSCHCTWMRSVVDAQYKTVFVPGSMLQVAT